MGVVVESRHVCEEFVTEGKECDSNVAIAMEVGERRRSEVQILFRNGGDMLLSALKSEMKKVIVGNPSAVLSVRGGGVSDA